MLILDALRTWLIFEHRISSVTETPVKRDAGSPLYMDMSFTYLGQLWIIEIDENAHKAYDKESEAERTRALPKGANLLRINPDQYFDPVENVVRVPLTLRSEFVHFGQRLQIVHVNWHEFERRIAIVRAFLQENLNAQNQMFGETVEGLRIIKFFY
jgi:hypothetical protein